MWAVAVAVAVAASHHHLVDAAGNRDRPIRQVGAPQLADSAVSFDKESTPADCVLRIALANLEAIIHEGTKEEAETPGPVQKCNCHHTFVGNSKVLSYRPRKPGRRRE